MNVQRFFYIPSIYHKAVTRVTTQVLHCYVIRLDGGISVSLTA